MVTRVMAACLEQLTESTEANDRTGGLASVSPRAVATALGVSGVASIDFADAVMATRHA